MLGIVLNVFGTSSSQLYQRNLIHEQFKRYPVSSIFDVGSGADNITNPWNSTIIIVI